jgi:hypothetical protein
MSSTTPHQTGAGRSILGIAAGLGLTLAALSALPAAAEVKLPSERGVEVRGGVAVGGALTNQQSIGSYSTSSDGANARTSLRIGTVERSKAGGSITNTTEIGDLTLRAQGRDAVSQMVVGTIEDVEADGSITNSVTIGSSLNIAIGAGARACTEIGTMGKATCR